ncbi:MAG: hypothetical protein LC808_32660 [Actinobacteria bacterium]|nr:hypothetical protein [Actinomycetota bacterium]
MIVDLVPRFGAERLPRLIQQTMATERQRGLVAAERVRTIGMVAEMAMWTVAGLSNVEGQLIVQVPLSEPRLRAIGDTAAGAIAAEIARLGRAY